MARITLLDCSQKLAAEIKSKFSDFIVETGTLGGVYALNRDGHVHQLGRNYNFPPFMSETDIFIIDLNFTIQPYLSSSLVYQPRTENGFWVKGVDGFIDTRICGVLAAYNTIQSLYTAGATVIVLNGEAIEHTEMFIGYSTKYHGIQRQENVAYSIYGFLDDLNSDHVSLENVTGQQVRYVGPDIFKNLAKYFNDCVYQGAFNPEYKVKERYTSLAENKNGLDVSFYLKSSSANGGDLFVFPKFSDEVNFTIEFLGENLPLLRSELFMREDKLSWLTSPEYLPERVNSINTEILMLQAELDSKIKAKKVEAEAILNETKYLRNILSSTGDDLVYSVIDVFKSLGIQKIEPSDTLGKTKNEDFQIKLGARRILVEVKGIVGTPSDEDILASTKYVPVRMREYGETDIFPLTIVNHQRFKKPADREKNIFRPEILDNCEMHQLGIITTVELFNFHRSFHINAWKTQVLEELLIGVGVIELRPRTHKFIGTVERVFKDHSSLGFTLEETDLTDDKSFSISIDGFFYDFNVDAYVINNESRLRAKVGEKVGFKLPSSVFERVRKGQKIYIISE